MGGGGIPLPKGYPPPGPLGGCEVGRDVHPSGRGLALEYRNRSGHELALVGYFPAD